MFKTVEGKNGINYTLNANQSITATGTSTGRANGFTTIEPTQLTPGHKWLILPLRVSGSNNFLIDFIQQNGNTYKWHNGIGYNGGVVEIRPECNNLRIEVEVASAAGVVANDTAFFNIFNLTQMFGSDDGIVTALGLADASEITTDKAIAAFERLFPQSYYAYDEGSLLSFNPTDIQTTGFNQYDNSKQTDNVHVLADQKYRIKGTYNGLTYSDGTDVTVTDGYFTPDRVDYLTLSGGNNIDTCVHLSWSGYRDDASDYEKYWSVNTDLTWIRTLVHNGEVLFPNGLCRAGEVYDEISDGKAIKRVGSVDLGTLDWSAAGAYETKSWGAALPHKKGTNAIAEKYISSELDGSSIANHIGYITLNDNENRIYVGNYNQPSPTGMLYYELATPIVVDLPEGINLNYRMDDFGTEEFINTTAVSDTPGLCKPTLVDIGYQTNLRDKIRRLDENYVSLNVQNNSESKKLTARQNIDAASTSGSYPQMTVGNLIADVDTPREFTFEQTGGGGTVIGNGYADVKKVEGNTIVWNQLVKIENLIDSITNSGITITNNGDGSLSFTGTAENSLTLNIIKYPYLNLTVGHKIFIPAPTLSGSFTTTHYSIGGNWFNTSSIQTVSSAATSQYIQITIGSGLLVDFKWYVNIFDLTQMFGAGNEPTVEEFERLFPMEYAPYCEGRLVSLGGYGIKWNQLVTQDVPQDFTGGYGTTVRKTQFGYFPVIAEHKYYCKLYGTNVPAFYGLVTYNTPFEQISTTVQSTSPSYIFTSNRTTQAAVWTYESSSESYTNVLANVIDLTEMFGPGSEPTLEEFEAMFGTEYYPYDEGTEMNVLEKMELQNDLSVKSTGFNLWNGTYTEHKAIHGNDGLVYDNGDPSGATDFIPVIGGETYYFSPRLKYASSINTGACYDANRNYISELRLYTIASGIVTLPENTRYIRLTIYMDSATDPYGCINLSDPAKNGTYLPYTTSTQDLSWIYDLEYTPEGSTTPEKLFPYGLLSAGSVHDEVTDTGAVKRVGVVDLGDLHGWSYGQYTSGQYYFNCAVSKMRQGDYYNVTTKNSKYTDSYWSYVFSNGTDKCLFTHGANNTICITDSSIDESVISGTAGTSSATIPMFSGIRLYYQLSTPITITFTSPKDLGYNVQSGGTEELLPTNPSGSGPITAPVLLSVNYPLDAVGTLTNLPRNYISVSSMDSFTTALGNFLNANITRTWDATNEKYTFTVASRT